MFQCVLKSLLFAGDASRCAYNVCVVTPVSSIELAIEYQWKACMQCPAFGCSALMSKTLIEHLTSATVKRSEKFKNLKFYFFWNLQIFETFVRMSTNHIELMEEVTRRRLRGLGTDTDLTDEELKMVGRLPRDPEGYIQCPRCAEFAVTPARFGRLRCRACLLPLCRDCESEHDRNVRCDGTPRYGSLAMALSSKKSHAVSGGHGRRGNPFRGLLVCFESFFKKWRNFVWLVVLRRNTFTICARIPTLYDRAQIAWWSLKRMADVRWIV